MVYVVRNSEIGDPGDVILVRKKGTKMLPTTILEPGDMQAISSDGLDNVFCMDLKHGDRLTQIGEAMILQVFKRDDMAAYA